MRGEKPILLIDDSEHDLLLMQYALERCDLGHRVITRHDGRQAIEYLSKAIAEPDAEDNPLPCLIITDLKMPKVDGLELLTWMRGQPMLESVPKLMLSSSPEDIDQKRAKDLGCWEYYVKPGRLDSLVKLVEELGRKWIVRHCGRVPAGSNGARAWEKA